MQVVATAPAQQQQAPQGGDTAFANMYLAYETLSDPEKRKQYDELVRLGAFGPGGFAVWNPNDNKLIEARGDAWRWMYWRRRGVEGIDEPGAGG